MAQIGWLEVDKIEHSGSADVKVTAEENTGRSSKTQILVWSGEGGVANIERTVIQQGKSEFVQIPSSEYSVPQIGGNITVTGTSNSKTLTIDKRNTGTLDIETPTVYYIGNTEIENGKGDDNDPGKDHEYTFQIVFNNIPANGGIEDKTVEFIVWGSNTNINDWFTIKSSKASASLSVTPELITLNAEGGTGTFRVESNVEWSVKGK